jgi:hypothetical protein
MKKTLLTGFFSLLFFFAFSQATFQKIYGGIHDESVGFAQQTSDGGYMIAGTTAGYGAGGYDFYLVKTNSAGDTLWTKTYGTTDDENLSSAKQTSDGGYILAGTIIQNSVTLVYVVRTTSTGSLSWTHSFKLTQIDFASSVQQTQDGGFLIAGYGDSISIATPAEYSFLIKLDPSGNTSWTKKYYNQAFQTTVREVGSGGFIVAGRILSGSTSLNGDILVMKTDVSGNPIWTKTFDQGEDEEALDIRETLNGEFIIVSETHSQFTGIEMYVLRINGIGALIWSKKYNAANTQIYPRSIIPDANGNFFIAGGFYPVSGGNGFLSKIDQNGQLLWTSIYGVSGYSFFNSVDFTSDGGLVMGGEISNATTPTDSGSLYMVRADVNGNSGCNQSTFSFTESTPVTVAATPVVTVYTGVTTQSVVTIVKSGCMVIDGCEVGIGENTNDAEATVFPNPFSEKTTVEISGLFSNEKSHFELFDVNGNIVREFYFTGNSADVERKNLSSGIYFYQILSGNKIITTGKIIAE